MTRNTLLLSVIAPLLFGCTQAMFKYQPGPPQSQLPRAGGRVAVLPFKDGTGEWVKEGYPSAFSCAGRVNMAKTGHGSCSIPYLPPDLLAKNFADELAASLLFDSARFAVAEGDVKDEAIVVDAAVLDATEGCATGMVRCEISLALEFRARSYPAGASLWTKRFALREDETQLQQSGVAGKGYYAAETYMLRKIFQEALQDMAAALTRHGPQGDPSAKPAEPSAEEILRRVGATP